ncbi:MAG: hypothetical protein IT431_01890 [Phycisphaerales bacterium]|nr:hypothetical protein [Phycisphaerales bacterium]
MRPIELILVAAALQACSGLPGLLGTGPSRWGERTAAAMFALAAALGMLGVLLPADGTDTPLSASWGLPGGDLAVAIDPVSRAFLLPVLLIPALGAVYGLGYWRQADHPTNGRKLRVFYGLMPAAMTVVVLAQNGIVFLMAWEVMAIAGFFLVSTEDDQRASREAAWVYFIAAHLGTLCLFGMFAVLHSAAGSFDFDAIAASRMAPPLTTAAFLLGLMGFGIKAGLMPLHVWLPGAHANAPSHVSAVLSGVMLKMGIYGLVRMTSLLPAPPTWWGGALLALGAVSAILGLVFAMAQHDLKRLLAYSSIENVGVITIGLGLALLGRSTGNPAWAVLGLGGAILHVWNHSLFKPLLFFGAGSILHGAGTRQIDHLGGLSRRMPRTAGLFLVGCVAICALPPLNGFASELLIYLGLLGTLDGQGGLPSAAAVVPVLALAGGLAAVAFAKLFGTAFLGEPRTETARHAHESPLAMILPMSVLAALCVAVGAFAAVLAPLLDRAIAGWWSAVGTQVPSVVEVSPLRWLPLTSAAIFLVSGVAIVALRRAMRTTAIRPGTWDCGYAEPSPRMQYTGSSFSQFAGSLFSWALLPRVDAPRIRGLFPPTGRFRSEVPDAVLDRMVLPSARLATHFLRWARVLQRGKIQIYMLYVLLTVLALFVSTFVL